MMRGIVADAGARTHVGQTPAGNAPTLNEPPTDRIEGLSGTTLPALRCH